MWQFTREIKIRMESLWMSFAVVLVLVATEVNAASLSSGFSSSVLPGISTSSLYPSIQNVTSSTKGGFSTVGISSKYAQLPSNTTSSLPSISTKTETSMLSISETRTLISHRTTIPLESSQSLTASQTSIEAVMNSVSSNYFVNSSSASSSSFNLNSSSAVILSEVRISSSTSQPLQTSEMSSSMQQSSMSTNMSYLSSVVSVAASQSGFVSATRTLSLTQLSPTVAKATSSQCQLSHTMTINGSSTGLSSQSIAGSSTPQLENSRMAPSSSVAMATNRTLATGHLTSSVLVDASESPSTIGMSSTISASTNSTFASKSKLFSMNDTVVVMSATIVNSSAHPVNATLMTTVLTSKATISPSPVVNFTLQSSTLASSVGLGVNQTRGVADSSALSPSRSVPNLNQTVSVVKTSDLLSSSSVPLQASPVAMSSSVVVEVKSSMVTAVGATSQSSSTSVPSPVGVVSSSVVSKNATMQSSTGVSLHRSMVASSSGTDSTGVVSLLPTASGEKSSPVSSTVAVSSSLLASLVATSSSVKVGVTSSIARATGESSSSMPSVVSSRLVFSQNVTSQSSSYARLTSKTVTPSSSSVETRMSRAASVTPNRTSTDEGLIVTSYSTPCYIYYVVEKTVLPVATANHSAVSPTSTTPKITLDIGSASSMHSGLPSVTLTHTVAMTTRVSKLQSQVVSSTDLLTSSTGLVGVSANSSEMMPSSTSTHLMSTALVSTSETASKVMVTHTSKVVQTEILTATSVTPSGTSSIFSDRRNTTIESVEHSQNSSLVQSSTMASVDPSASSVEVLSSSHIHASPSASLVIATLSESKVSSMSTEIKSSPQVASSSLQLTADNKTTTSNIQMSPSSSSIHPSSNVSSSVVEPQSSAMLSQAGTTSIQTSSSNQVAAASSSLSQSGNKTSAYNTQMFPQSSVMLSLFASISQAGATSVPANSSPQVATSSSVSQANSTSSPAEHLPSSSSPLETSSSISSSKRRRKKRAIGDTNSTTLGVHFSSSVVVTSLSGEPVASTSQGVSAVSSVVPSAHTASQTLQISNSVMLSVEGGSSQGLVPTSVLTLSGQSQSVSEPPPSPSISVSSSLSTQAASFSGDFTPTAALPASSPSASSVSIQKPTGNTTSGSSAILMATGSATTGVSPSLPVNVTESHTGSVAQSPSSATVHVSLTPSGTVTQSRGVLVSSSTESLVPQVSETVGSMTTHTNLSVTNVVGTMASSSSGVVPSIHVSREQSSSLGVAISSIVVDNHTLSSTSSRDIVTSSVELGTITSTFDNRTVPSTSSLDLKPPKSAVLPNSTSSLAQSVTRFSPSAQSSLLAVVISSTSVDSGSLPSTSSSDLKPSASAVSGNSSSTLTHSVTSVSSSVQSLSASAIMSSTFVDNRTLPSTSSQDLMMSSAVLGNSSSTLAHSTTDPSQPSTVIGKGSVTASSFVVVVPSPTSVSLGSSSSSLTQQPRESSITISSSPQPTIIKNVTSTVSSSPSSFSVMLSALQSSSEMTSLPSPSSPSQLSSPTTDPASQGVSSSVLTRPSSSAVQSSEIQETVAASSSVTIASSSRVYRPPLVTISSLGICYVVYTTRIVQPSLVSTLPVSMSSTVSVNATSTPGFSVFTHSANATSIQLSPSLLLNTSSAVVQTTLDVKATSSQSPQVVSTAVSVNVTVKPSGSSSRVVISTTMPPVNSTSSRPALTSSSLKARTSEVTQSANVSQSRAQKSSTSSSTIPSSSVAFTAAHSIKETPLPTSTHLLSTQVFTSQVISPTRTVSQVVSSSATAPPTQPPDRSLLIEAIFNVPQNTDIQSKAFKEDLEVRLADAYRFVELTSRRRRRATPEINATIDSIQRVNNAGDVNVTFFITKDGQRVPASDAAQNYEKLSKAQLGSLVKLDVVSMPQPLVVPTTPPLPSNILVSLIIQDSASNNISIAENRNRLENNLAAYYNEQKQLTTAKATIKTILHEPNEIVYLEFYITVDGQAVNASVVVETFKVPHVNLLTAKLGVQVLVQVYIPDSLTANEADYVIIGVSVPENQDLTNASFRSDLANKLVTLYQTAKGKKNRRRKKRSGSTSATIKDIVRNPDSTASEADVTFFVFDAGKVVNASYVVTVMNRLSTNEMTTVTRPYAVLSAPRRAIVPTSPTEITPTVAPTEIKWWIIPAVLCPILLIIVIILLICWRWKKGAPKSKVEPDTIRMLDTNKRKPVQGFDVARYTEPGVSGMKETSFMSRSPPSIADDEEAAVKPARRETSLRRKVQKRPIQKPPVREQRQTNPAYEEEEEEEDEDESVVSVTPPGSTEALTRVRAPAAKPPSASRKTAAKPQRPVEPSESEEDSELSEDVSESEPESVPQPQQTRHSAAQVPTVAVMSEASGPPRYPPVRFRSSVHPAPSLPPLDAKQTSLVGVKVEPPSEDDSTRGQRKKKVTKRELEQRADLERQKNKQRLRDRKRNASYSPGSAVPRERKAWDRAQYDFDDVLGDEDAERVITGKKRKPRRRRPPSSSVATDEEGVPHLKSYRKLKSPKTTSSTTSTRDRGKKHAKSADSASNASSDESEIDMNETRRRMHAMLDDAFSLFGPQLSKKLGKEPEGQPAAHPEAHPEAHPGTYPATPARPAVIPRYIGGQPALPEPPPAHGRATEPTPRQRRRVQPTMPGYPAGMPQTYIGMPGYPGHPPARPVVTRDPIVVWDPADRQRILNQQAPPPTYPYRDPSGQNVYITPVQQQRDDMGGLVWSPYAAEDSMDALYPDLAQASYPGALSTSPPKDTSFLSRLQAAPPHDTVLNMSAGNTLDQRGASLGQSPQPLIKSIKDELFRLSQGASRKTPITEL